MNPVKITLSLQSNNREITLGFREVIQGGGALPWYDGEYDVIPGVISQVLQTRNKGMRQDVTVEPIPYAEVSNPQGGKTITIA